MVLTGEPLAPVPLPSGTLLNNRYRLDRTVGRPGGFGVTYRATDTSPFQRAVAIKEYFPVSVARRQPGGTQVTPRNTAESRSAFEDGLNRFRREAGTLAGLAQAKHSGIVQVHDVFEENGTVYLVMELITGAPLSDIARERRLTADEVADLAVALLAALAAVHAAGLVHCDIKPANIMRDDAGRWVLIDFGSAKRTCNPDRAADPGTLPLAATLDYAAPELLKAEPEVAPPADLFALAATLYQLVTSQPPVGAVARLTELQSGHRDPLIGLTALRLPDVAPGLARMIDRGLALPVAQRPQTAAEMRGLMLTWEKPVRPPRPWIAALALGLFGALPFLPSSPDQTRFLGAGLLGCAGLALFGLRGRLGLPDCLLGVTVSLAAAHIAGVLFAPVAAGGEVGAPWPAAALLDAESADRAALVVGVLAALRLLAVVNACRGPLAGLTAVLPGLALLGIFAADRFAIDLAAWPPLQGIAGAAGWTALTAGHCWTAQVGTTALALFAWGARR